MRRSSKKRRVPGIEDSIRRVSTSKIEEETEEKDIIRRRPSTSKIEDETSSSEWDVFTEEILSRLPAERLEILKTVCKNWWRIFSTPYFVRLHLNNVYNQSQIRVLTISWRNSAINMYNINFVVEKTKEIPFLPLIRNGTFFKFMGSCDGLLCLFIDVSYKIVVYNPSTGKYFLVKLPPDYINYTMMQCSWFGRHPSSGEYVLVSWDFNRKVGVYKFRDGPTLELIQSTPSFISMQFSGPVNFTPFDERGTLLHGALHWPVRWRNSHDYRQFRLVICTYHLENNKYSEISPPGPVQDRFNLGVNAEGCLFAIFNSGNDELMEMWVMKEYGVEQSWTKHANIVGPYKYMVLSPLGLFPNGDLILDARSYGLIKYSFNDNKVVSLITNYVLHRSDVIVCVDSLVSPKIVISEEFMA